MTYSREDRLAAARFVDLLVEKALSAQTAFCVRETNKAANAIRREYLLTGEQHAEIVFDLIDNGVIRPSELKAETGLSDASLSAAFKLLEAAGKIRLEQISYRGRGRPMTVCKKILNG